MIVLDYLKKTKNLTVVVPPFHTGHLGLIPGTEVQVGIMSPYTAEKTHCEIVISPVHQTLNQMTRITCTMRDEVGVVGRLVEAVSMLGINIATQESSSINHADHHTVNLLVDLSTSERLKAEIFNAEFTKRSAIRNYAKYESILPLHDKRYITIFESIIAHCADKIVWKNVLGRNLPQLKIEPLSFPEVIRPTTAQIHSIPDRPYHVKVKIPKNIELLVRKNLQNHDGNIHYIILSDTDERSLRVYFPTDEVVGKIVHVGFFHSDIPGVLSEITSAVARAGFSILTSLLRKETSADNVWETVLHYKGKQQVPNPENVQEVCEWVAALVTKHATNISSLKASRVEVTAPRYPRPSGNWSGRVKIRDEGKKQTAAKKTMHTRLEERLKAVAPEGPYTDMSRRVEDLILLVDKNIKKSNRGSIFLSYPTAARKLAEILKSKLKDHYELNEYQSPDGEPILEQVLERILDSDFFIGVWQHDQNLKTQEGKYAISPWMPFEYGIAFAAEKPRLVVHSEELDERFWRRIEPSVATPGFYADSFEDKAVPVIYDYCRKHFI